jgi:hypothetical protein
MSNADNDADDPNSKSGCVPVLQCFLDLRFLEGDSTMPSPSSSEI